MEPRARARRKLLVASIGVAAVTYVACGGKAVTSDSTNPGGGADAGREADGFAGIGGTIIIANLIAPCAYNEPLIGQSQPLALTNPEYDRTVRDLLGDTSAPSKEFPVDDTNMGFRQDVGDQPVRRAHYAKAAGDVADRTVARLTEVLPCDPASAGEEACASQFIAAFGKRAYRRPLVAAELASLKQAYADARATGTMATGIRAVIVTALTSPHFYMVEEQGAASPKAVLLGPHALASRLSYFIYRSMPDAELTAAADAGKLSTKQEVEAQARRMLQSPQAHDAVTDFFREWLRLDRLLGTQKSIDVFPSFELVREAMITETTRFAESLFFADGLYKDLMTSTSTWANSDLAAIYGEPFLGTGFQTLKLNPTVRAGLLTQPSILSMTSGPERTSPTRRGAFVRDIILCQPIPPPPPNHPGMLDPPAPGMTTRQQLEAAKANAVCNGCHRMMDPIGYGLEEFDAVGRLRSMDNGLPIDASGNLENIGADGPFTGAVEMASKLSTSYSARECFAAQWFRFALSRSETSDDECSIMGARDNSGKMTDIVVAIATSDSFRYVRW